MAPIPDKSKQRLLKMESTASLLGTQQFRVVPSLLSVPSRMESKFHTLVGVIVEAMILTAALLSTMFLIAFLVGLHF